MHTPLYLIIKAAHIVSIIAWMAGVLYLFRLFVYHAEETERVVKARFQVMERRLYRYITLPAMLLSLVSGIALLLSVPLLFAQGWLHAKLLFVVGLIGLTHFGGAQITTLAEGTCKISPKTFRYLNEIPTLLMVAIVFLVVLKPF